MQKLLFFALAISNTLTFGQIIFEKGYFIDNGNKKVDCLIKNMDWRKNPKEFEYKLSEGDEIKTNTIRYVKEFGIYDISKYYRYTLPVERSSESISQLSESREPKYKEETLFLKTLIEGEASLYLLQFSNNKKYFFKTNSIDIEQLIFKKYLDEKSKNIIRSNNLFRKQLWNKMKCSNFTIEKVNSLEYEEKSLVNFFTEYNSCNQKQFIQYNEKQKRESFHLNIRAGINYSSLTIKNAVTNTRDTKFDNTMNFRVGLETEYVLPFNKNKWSIFAEPTYHNFKSEKKLSTEKVSVEYSSIELPFGIRHYFFLNQNTRLFINGALILDFNDKSKIDFENSNDLDIDTEKSNLAYGIGFKYKNKFSIELRNHTNKEVLNRYLNWGSDYKKISLIFGYSIF